MLSRGHRRAATRIAAALVAIALSGIGDAAEAGSSPDAHVCRCPRGEHHCTCPVCSRTGADSARVDPDGARDREHRGPAEGDDRCRVTSACHVPEAVKAADGHEPFTLPGPELAVAQRLLDSAPTVPIAPRTTTRRPAVPPPRS